MHKAPLHWTNPLKLEALEGATGTLRDRWLDLFNGPCLIEVLSLQRHHFAVALYRLGCCSRDGLLLATGYFRNGVLLSAITGEIISALVLGEPSPTGISPFLYHRL